jgi:ribonucleotide reductase alpha subunit
MSEFSNLIFKRTYAITPDETWEQCAKRVSKFVAELANRDNKALEDRFYRVISQKKFIPGGRYLYSAGRPIAQTSNCFLLRAEDSREGWAKLVSKHIVALSTGGGVGTEYSDIRCKGSPIKSFGGVASGPVSLMTMVNEVARQVMAGGKRRSALWAGLNWQHPDVEEFISTKNWSLSIQAFKEKDFNFPAPLDMTNISVGLDDEFFKRIKKDKDVWDFYYKICKSMCKTGEPGFSINIGDKSSETLRNPCQPGWATVLTPEGIRNIRDVNSGNTIWSGKRWTKISKKWSTGVKPVYTYFTTAGWFMGTDTHRVVQCGEKIPVREASGLDRNLGPKDSRGNLNPQDIMDGLVLGDGSIHKASGDLVYLIIGENDQDYFQSEIKHLLKEHRPGLSEKSWEIHTTITPGELPKTWQREVPDRFFHGNATKVRGFLRGLFSANGSAKNDKYKRIGLKQSSPMLIKQVQELLSSLGIASYITTNKATKITHHNGEYTSKQSYELNIGDTAGFYNQIGFLQKYKILTEQSNIQTPKITFDINRVELIGEDEVFDIEVEDPDHTYWTGGVLVSNCTEVVSHKDSDICNLGSVNLSRIKDIDELCEVTEIGTIFLYLGTHTGYIPHPDFYSVREEHRRIGLGIMGLHEWCLKNGEPYGPSEKLGMWLGDWANVSTETARSTYTLDLASGTKPIAIRACAPTGTIGIIGETTTGMEPIFCVAYKRRFLDNNGKWKYNYVIDPTAERLIQEGIKPEDIEDAYSLSHDVERRISMQAFVQDYIDQGISSTINVPAWGEPGNNNCKHFAETLLKYLPRLRGITLYPDGARSGQPLTPVKYETAISKKDVTFEEGEDRCAGGVCGL